jgi:hypothetical protein
LSCSKILDVSPTDSVPAETAIENAVGAERALIGCYNSLQSTSLYGRNLIITGDLAADNLIWTGTTLEFGQIHNKPIPAENAIVDGFWSASYDGINRVNSLVDRLAVLTDLSTDSYNHLMGEALFLRGLFYLNLVTYFGDVPLRIKPVTDLSSFDIKRSPREDVYNQIISDLTQAVSMLDINKITGFADKNAATALLARTYLQKYHLTGNADMAVAAAQSASLVIESGKYSIDTSFANLFVPSKISSESIFEVKFDVQNYTRLAQYFYTRDSSGRYEIAPTPDIINLYDSSDLRAKSQIRLDKNQKPYVVKYNDIDGGTDHVYVLRLAEMYLIRAEALAFTNSNITQINADLNRVRKRAGIDAVNSTSFNELIDLIALENRREFAFEGHRWSDLVRTGKAEQVLGINTNYTLFPIPLSEIQTNKLVDQNPGY